MNIYIYINVWTYTSTVYDEIMASPNELAGQITIFHSYETDSKVLHPTYYLPIPIGSMYAIYGNICHQYNIPQMLAYVYIYILYMDPMGY